jgi:PhnB protein
MASRVSWDSLNFASSNILLNLKTKIMKLNPYLNFDGKTEEAFHLYQSVFGGELFIQKMNAAPGTENFTEEEKNLVMHASLPIGDGQFLMASDCVTSCGQVFKQGNSNYISIAPDSREEADRIFNALSDGGNVEMPMQDMFWGDYFGTFQDKYGVCWMINYSGKTVDNSQADKNAAATTAVL